MEHPDKIEIRKGYFSESTANIDDSFVFVNMDMDLYLPMLEGLKFFYDKVVVGGSILSHDFFLLPGWELKKRYMILKWKEIFV